ncbi:hypothetical protein ES708_22674 [subsurface metagenome]
MGTKVEEKVEMNELLRKAGISHYELGNWIKRGLLPKWCSRYVDGGQGSRYYYPAWAVERAADIKRLRKQGYPMQLIRKILAGEKVGL